MPITDYRKRQLRKRQKALKAAGATYADVARLAGVSWTFIWMWMHGQRTSAKVKAAFEQLTNGQRIAT